jgi:hypothetical protein
MQKILIYRIEGKAMDGSFIPSTTEEDLTDYWKCGKCNSLFKTFNDQPSSCKFCNDSNIQQLSDFDYMAELKKKSDEEYKKELKDKQKREGKMVNLLALGELKRKREYRKNIN